jgi:hypothetical protein
LISSNKDLARGLSGHVNFASSDLEWKDVFYLMTDAISCWFLKQVEMGQAPWELLDPVLEGKDSIDNLLDQLRQDKEIRNDDVTVMRIQVGLDQ